MADPVRETPEFPLYDTYPGKLRGDGVTGETTVEPSHMLPATQRGMNEVGGGGVVASCVVDNKIREKSLGSVVNELKVEAKEFASTRLQMLTAEIQEKVGIFKVVVPMVAVAFVFAWVGFFALTAALIAIVAT